MLENSHCRKRQQRFWREIGALADAVVVGSPTNVYYLTGYWTDWKHHSAAILFADGRVVLFAPNKPAKDKAVDDSRSFEANWNGTLRQEQAMAVAAQLVEILHDGGAKRVGFDASDVSSQLLLANLFPSVPVDRELYQVRRVKLADELALMLKAIRATEAMYARAREIIEPGVEELHVYNELHATAVQSLGETMPAILGNDYACGAGGGPPRAGRKAAAGELYVLDLGPCYRGYFADNCRVTAVDRKPTDAQLNAWRGITEALAIVESMARPGAKCVEIYTAVEQHFQRAFGRGQPHHLGHGVGLSPHEFPHLNPKWDDTLIEGEIFTAEPGIYGTELGGGIRLENQYLVTSDGVKNLLNFPLEMV
jgi:Xaa-Pro dipeptidase